MFVIYLGLSEEYAYLCLGFTQPIRDLSGYLVGSDGTCHYDKSDAYK